MRGIVFDLDETLYPRDHFVYSGFAAVSRYVEREWHVPAVQAFTALCRAMSAGKVGRELQALCEHFGRPAGDARDLLRVYRTHRPDLTLSDGSREALLQLRRDGWRIGILTNGLPDVQARKVSALGLRPLVHEVVYAAEYAEGGKPACAAFDVALTRLGVRPSRAVMVGDDLRCDIYGAREAGMRTIRVMLAGGLPAIADDADAVIESIEEVPALAGFMITNRPARLRRGDRVLGEVANVA
jgi:putative hydrolase of the HAD superfamily